MFEGKPPLSGESRPLGERDGEALRPLSWGDLVARLSAARELRAAYRAGDGGPIDSGARSGASFDAGSARRIAAHHNGKDAVNLDSSGNGKGPASTSPDGVMLPGCEPFRGAARN